MTQNDVDYNFTRMQLKRLQFLLERNSWWRKRALVLLAAPGSGFLAVQQLCNSAHSSTAPLYLCLCNSAHFLPTKPTVPIVLTVLACIDKWVNSKFEDATPPALCSGPKLAIWNKNQPPRPEKTPGHGEKSKMAILVLFGSRRSLGEKETDLYNDSCPTVFNLYDIHTPQTPARHP